MKNLKAIEDALDKWHKQEKQIKFLKAREETLNNELHSVFEERNQIYRDRYKYTDIAINECKYWRNEDSTVIVKIGDLNRLGFGIEFFVTQEGKKEEKYYSSSLTILNHADIPITKEEYEKLCNTI